MEIHKIGVLTFSGATPKKESQPSCTTIETLQIFFPNIMQVHKCGAISFASLSDAQIGKLDLCVPPLKPCKFYFPT